MQEDPTQAPSGATPRHLHEITDGRPQERHAIVVALGVTVGAVALVLTLALVAGQGGPNAQWLLALAP